MYLLRDKMLAMMRYLIYLDRPGMNESGGSYEITLDLERIS